MARDSNIQWTDHTWNPWIGCHKVSPGCKHCYMFRDRTRYGQDPNTVTRTKDSTFFAPLKWDKEPAFVFVPSWSDFFIEEADPWRDEAWEIVRQTPYFQYLVLTKRPERIADHLPETWKRHYAPNVWLGVSVENADYYWRIEELLKIPAYVHFVSYEPALGPVSFARYFNFIPNTFGTVDWVISGGESGPRYRPADESWFRTVRDECLDHQVPFFHKQHGGSRKIDGAWGGRKLDGEIHNGRPVPLSWPSPNTIEEERMTISWTFF